MRKIIYFTIAMLALTVVVAHAEERKRRVIFMPDGRVNVITPVKKCPDPTADETSRWHGLSKVDCEEEVFKKAVENKPGQKAQMDSGNYKDMLPSELPQSDRRYWRGTKATGIHIDPELKAADEQAKVEAANRKNKALDKLKALGLTSEDLKELGIK
jgi:hypothetical protein